MKKILAVFVVALLAGGATLQAATVKDNCGCGFGGMALGDSDATFVNQLLATFLNGICGNQTLGITSGTLGCEPFSAFAMKKEMTDYVAANMDHLSMDMAMGQGDSLEAIADLMEVDVEARADLFVKLQSSFDSIFSNEDVSASDVVDSITEIANG